MIHVTFILATIKECSLYFMHHFSLKMTENEWTICSYFLPHDYHHMLLSFYFVSCDQAYLVVLYQDTSHRLAC